MAMTTKQAAEKWGISSRRVRVLCMNGQVEGAWREGKLWFIPDNAPKPADVLKVFSVLYGLCDKLYSLLEYNDIIHIDKRIQHTIEYINQNYRWHIDIDELAKLSNLSVSRFHHCFKEQTGMTPIEYKNNLCIKYAITQLVSNEKKSIEEISSESGFESSTYFRRVFKDITKRTPREYRQIVNNSML